MVLSFASVSFFFPMALNKTLLDGDFSFALKIFLFSVCHEAVFGTSINVKAGHCLNCWLNCTS